MIAASLLSSTAMAGSGASPSKTSVDFTLAYDVYFGGAHVGGLQVGVGLAPSAYNMYLQARTVGLIDRLFHWRMQARSHGLLEAGMIKPLQAEHGNVWRGKTKHTTLVYDGDRIKVTRTESGKKKEIDKDVPDALRRATFDTTSAILRVALTMRAGRNCANRVPIFNGGRRFDLVMTSESAERLNATRYSPFSGTAQKCKVWLRRLGEKNPSYDEVDHNPEGSADEQDRGRGWKERDKHGFVWIGRVFEDAPPMPVRIKVETRFGNIMGHLRSAEMSRDGVKQRLAIRGSR